MLELIDLVKSGDKWNCVFSSSLFYNLKFFCFSFIYKRKKKISFIRNEDEQTFFYLQYCRMVLVGFDNFPNCFLNILINVRQGDIFWFYSTTIFNNVNIIFIESFCKPSFANYNFIFLNKGNIIVC